MITVIIDAITNSIRNVKTNEMFDTEVLPLSQKEARMIHKKNGWNFNWKSEFKKENRKLYKLVIQGENEIHGLVSLEVLDRYIEMHLIEGSAKNLGRNKEYAGVAGNLVAYACKLSFEYGFSGYVSFHPKTRLIEHYQLTLGAEMIYRNRMQIATESAKKLVNSYYKTQQL